MERVIEPNYDHGSFEGPQMHPRVEYAENNLYYVSKFNFKK